MEEPDGRLDGIQRIRVARYVNRADGHLNPDHSAIEGSLSHTLHSSFESESMGEVQSTDEGGAASSSQRVHREQTDKTYAPRLESWR